MAKGAGVLSKAQVIRADLSEPLSTGGPPLSCVSQLCNRRGTHSSASLPHLSRLTCCALQAHLSEFGAGNLGCGHSPIHWPGVAVVSAHARLQPRGRWLLEAC